MKWFGKSILVFPLPGKTQLREIVRSAKIFALDEFRQRLADGIIGAFWLFLAPLLQLTVFYFVFVELFQSRSAGVDDYLVFLAIGFWPWLAFSETVTRCTSVFVERAAIAKKVRISRIGMFFGIASTSFVFHLIGFALVLFVLAYLGSVRVSAMWFYLPALWLLLYFFSVCVALIFALINVFVRDTAKVVGLLLTIWFFTTPIFYPVSSLPKISVSLQALNPIGSIIQMNRDLVGGAEVVDASFKSIALVVGVALLAVFLYWRVAVELEEFS